MLNKEDFSSRVMRRKTGKAIKYNLSMISLMS